MKLKLLLVLPVWCMQMFTYAQTQNFSVDQIPDSLKKHADAVIRDYKKEIEIINQNKMMVYFTQTITVLNKDGDQYVAPYKTYSNDSKIKKIGAILYNQNGHKLVTYKKKDFRDQSAIDGFYSEDRVKFLSFTPRDYPYTLTFSYVFQTETTAFFPRWYPVSGYNISVQNKEIKITNNTNTPLKHVKNNINKIAVQNLSSENKLHFKIQNQIAVENERYSPYFEEKYPNIKFYLEQFTLKGHQSISITNWKDFGWWLRTKLYQDRVSLSPETQQKVKELVKGIQDPLKKAEIIYNYMQNKTRYVNVAIGVGGWQPSLASDVDRLGYGDCKGLSNYTKALLDVVGIESNWVIVYAKQKRNFDKQYHGMQGNHMILNLPKLNNGKDVWLECTNQTLPFNYLGSFTDDRDVLVLEKEGGVLKHTPIYTDKNNLQISNATLQLQENGHLNAHINIQSKGINYDDDYVLETYTPKELDRYYKFYKWSYNNNVKITSHQFTNQKNKQTFAQDLDLLLEDYATIMGNEMIFKINALNQHKQSVAYQKDRQHPLVIRRGYNEKDSITLKIPKGYSIETLPKDKNIQSEFGNYALVFKKVDEHTLTYQRDFYQKQGTYPKEKYNDYGDFIRSVTQNDNLKLVLSKK
ncbi:DUF3857 domain-containing protein [Ochrovirga pacifica]|uniref:DUF3857 domain-containing protein n=1 Tax=Ochrovirga pacifica TaxID=1042376 RepID=UPI000A008A7B|nr:DUF3857 domain-containing protein [Ochrovirga pacifica]